MKTLTVGELIEKLKKMPKSAHVFMLTDRTESNWDEENARFRRVHGIEYVEKETVYPDNTGDQSAATNTGNQSTAIVEGKDSVAIVTGYKSKAKGNIGDWIVLTERGDWNGDTFPILDIKAFKVDGELIKANTFYELIKGKPVEVK